MVQNHLEFDARNKVRASVVAYWSVENLTANSGDKGSIPDPGRSHVPRNSQTHGPQLLSQRSAV